MHLIRFRPELSTRSRWGAYSAGFKGPTPGLQKVAIEI